jgi:hypothetical protein
MTTEDLTFYARTFGTVLSFLALSVLAIWAPRIRRVWLRRSLRVTGAVALLPGLLALFVLLSSPKYTSVFRLPSPDGRIICYVKDGGSGATVDWVSITVRPALRPIAQEVYFTFGAFDPKVRWRDSKTLEIRYPQGDEPQLCKPSNAGVNVVCSAAPRAEFYPLEKSDVDP